jgi:gamma-glutamyltranspeptidase/glutathione hydrolase
MVAAPHYLASGAGLEALRRGGSAVDAAIAMNAVLCVVYPHMAGIGGDGFWLVQAPGAGAVGINASGPAARAATADFYRHRGHVENIPPRGFLAALTVPGAVDGWRLAHERFGRLPWSDLFADAIEHARDGFPVSRSLADWLVRDAGLLALFPETTALFLRGGAPLREAERLVQTALARSLELLAERGARAAFYEGELAERMCAALATGGSPLQAEDFGSFEAEWVEPIATSYRGFEALTLPPNTQGFAALQILNLIEGFDVAAWGDGTADYYHHLAEAVKLSFADRDTWLTDPRWVDIPLERLISKAYAAERRELIRADRALAMQDVAPGIAYRHEMHRRSPGGDTCYFCAVDARGFVVSCIQSIYHAFGSCAIGGDTGIILQNRGSFFALDERHPNHLHPGKRTFHTLIPALLRRDGEPVLACGTMGGEGQSQTQAALVTRVVDFGYDVQQAIEAPRWLMGRTWGAESHDLWLESRVPNEVALELQRRGQPVKLTSAWSDSMGHAQAIRIDREREFLEGGADPRGDGIAAGY